MLLFASRATGRGISVRLSPAPHAAGSEGVGGAPGFLRRSGNGGAASVGARPSAVAPSVILRPLPSRVNLTSFPFQPFLLGGSSPFYGRPA